MKTFVTTILVGSALMLTACAGTDGSADYQYESQAPYADERTVGADEEPAPATRTFERAQRK